MKIYFENTEAGIRDLAVYTAELVRQGIQFEGFFDTSKKDYVVILTGGY